MTSLRRLSCLLTILVGIGSYPLAAQRLYIPIRGINVHQQADTKLDTVRQMRLNWVRMDFNWHDAQPTETGPFDWSYFDDMVEAARSRGLKIYGNLTSAPLWACRSGDATGGACVPRSALEWSNYVTAVAFRYRGAVSAYGLWNEPDEAQFFHGSPADYVNVIMVPGAQALRLADPSALVCAPDLSGSSGATISPSAIFSAMAPWAGVLDRVSLHSYPDSSHPGPNGVLDKIFSGDLLTWLSVNGFGAKPLWITEFACDGCPTVAGTEAIFELFGPRENVEALFVYQLLGSPGGLVNSDGSLTPSGQYLRDHVPDGYEPDPPFLVDRFDYPWSQRLHRWLITSGSPTPLITNGGLSGTASGLAAKVYEYSLSDFALETSARITDTLGLSYSWIGLVGRTQSPNDTHAQSGYLGFLRANGEAVLWSSSGLNVIAQTYVNPVQQYVRLKLSAVGTRVAFSVNGTEVIAVNDATYPAGYVGIQDNAIGVHDNVMLTVPVPGATPPTWQTPQPLPLGYYPLTPCRLVDTRTSSGQYTPIYSGVPVRRFPAWEACGIPNRAVALTANITSTGATDSGSFHIFPAGFGVPSASVMSFRAGLTRAGAGTLGLFGDPPGSIDVFNDAATGWSHLVIDVSGYFAPIVGQ